MRDSRPLLFNIASDATPFPPLQREALEVVQANLGYRCNLSCAHCHVNAGPKRTEQMDWPTIAAILDFCQSQQVKTLDLTGGAPEMNPHFKQLVTEAVAQGLTVMDRCNLTILLQPGYESLPEFLAEHKVIVVASLPCYLEENVEQQRGKGIFAESIEAIQRLNDLGYGRDGERLLNLVYNPIGPTLPPAQQALEQAYKTELLDRFGIVFNELYTITNMPISRFGSALISKGQFEPYMNLLKDNYAEANLETVMCRHLMSIDWQGFVYDCDFNQMLDLPMIASDKPRTHINELKAQALAGLPIVTADHCFGCTAGQGSSCGGALAE